MDDAEARSERRNVRLDLEASSAQVLCNRPPLTSIERGQVAGFAKANGKIARDVLDTATSVEFKCCDQDAEREIKLDTSLDGSGADVDMALGAWLTDCARRAALVVAHPAHEMRLLQWLSRTRAHAYILTQGSRSGTDAARREASERLIVSVGGAVSNWGGIWDRDFYRLVLDGKGSLFARWTRQLADDFVRRDVDLVVADAWQYYNVAHDLTHLMARLAVERASAVLGRRIAFFDFPVVPTVLAPGAPAARIVARLQLDDAEAAAKNVAVAAVADVAGEAAEIEGIEGREAYRSEVFCEPPALSELLATPPETPLYERFGQQRVQSNIYFDVIRWRHVAAICRALTEAGCA